MVLGWKRPGRVWICQAIVASLAQSVEHAAVNRSVNGSSPLGSAILEIQHTIQCVFLFSVISLKEFVTLLFMDMIIMEINYFVELRDKSYLIE